MVKAIEITKVSIRDRLVVDADVRMLDPQDFDFSPSWWVLIVGGNRPLLLGSSGEASCFFYVQEPEKD